VTHRVLVALLLAGVPLAAHAASPPNMPRAVWARGASAYVDAGDSAAAPGDRIVFMSHGKTIAEATVTRVDPGGLALVTLTVGSLAKQRRLDRVRVFIEKHPPFAPTSLTIGCPAPGKRRALLGCAAEPPPANPPPAGYRLRSQNATSYRLERDPGPPSRWPDTLTVRWFEDPADEGIAFDRGEIDVALFWPGELLASTREQPRWQGTRLGARLHGVIVAFAAGSCGPSPPSSRAPSAADTAMIAGLSGYFRGDVVPWAVAHADSGRPALGRDALPRLVADVDPECEGLVSAARYLNRTSGAQAAGGCLRLTYLGAARRAPDSLALAIAGYVRSAAFAPDLKARADSLERAIRGRAADAAPLTATEAATALRNALGVVQLWTIRCPVVGAPDLRAYLDRLGADAFADLIGRPTGIEP
jgi:hypothetical protein